MVISLVLETITGYNDGHTLAFYGESASALYAVCGRPYAQDESYLGRSWLCPPDQLDIISPKMVKAGYKMKIHNGTRLNHD